MSTGLLLLTIVHVAISLAGIVTGFVVVFGFLGNKACASWTKWFLNTTVATSVTGFFFPVHKFMPSHAVGILSLIVLALAMYARSGRHLAGGWRKAYVIGAVVALYFNVFVLVVQSFQKIPALKDLAPTQTEPPFKLAQLFVLGVFIVLGIFAAIRFKGETAEAPVTQPAAPART